MTMHTIIERMPIQLHGTRLFGAPFFSAKVTRLFSDNTYMTPHIRNCARNPTNRNTVVRNGARATSALRGGALATV